MKAPRRLQIEMRDVSFSFAPRGSSGQYLRTLLSRRADDLEDRSSSKHGVLAAHRVSSDSGLAGCWWSWGWCCCVQATPTALRLLLLGLPGSDVDPFTPLAGAGCWNFVYLRVGNAQGCATSIQVLIFLLLDFAQAGKDATKGPKRQQSMKSGADKHFHPLL